MKGKILVIIILSFRLLAVLLIGGYSFRFLSNIPVIYLAYFIFSFITINIIQFSNEVGIISFRDKKYAYINRWLNYSYILTFLLLLFQSFHIFSSMNLIDIVKKIIEFLCVVLVYFSVDALTNLISVNRIRNNENKQKKKSSQQ